MKPILNFEGNITNKLPESVFHHVNHGFSTKKKMQFQGVTTRRIQDKNIDEIQDQADLNPYNSLKN